eukprot:TRINITY_DN12894_c0_g1_i1.p1 TRINITY_DN12894_c0_g1~~TRINITY_DN12894_c0_g1_i1.p1  ORF type:complete len:246 (+),score=62.45 TRINITY_DN12894_c0_g1_i1:213-950(+)
MDTQVEMAPLDSPKETRKREDNEGPVKLMDPGRIWNGVHEMYIKIDGRSLKMFINEEAARENKFLEELQIDNFDYPVNASKENHFIFHIHLKQPSSSGKTDYYFKLDTTKDDRDKWVDTFNELVPKPPPPQKEVPANPTTEGTLRQIYPGYIYNSTKDIYARIVVDENDKFLGLYTTPTEALPYEKIHSDNIAFINESQDNKFAFILSLLQPLPNQTTTMLYFKVLTTPEDRHNWVISLNYLFNR